MKRFIVVSLLFFLHIQLLSTLAAQQEHSNTKEEVNDGIKLTVVSKRGFSGGGGSGSFSGGSRGSSRGGSFSGGDGSSFKGTGSGRGTSTSGGQYTPAKGATRPFTQGMVLGATGGAAAGRVSHHSNGTYRGTASLSAPSTFALPFVSLALALFLVFF